MGDGADADEAGNPLPERIFAEVTPSNIAGPELEGLDSEEDEILDIGSETNNLVETTAGEAAKYGIFYDDRDYDYTQHLKPIGKTPGAVFMTASAMTIDEDGPESTKAILHGDLPESLINKAMYDNIKDTDADPAVLEALDALDDEAFIDEDGFDDDFVVKLDREEARILAPLPNHNSKKNRKPNDEEFDRFLEDYDVSDFDLEDLNISEYSYTDDESEEIDVEVKPFGKGGPSRLYQVDEVRKELLGENPDQTLLNRILYTSDDEDGGSGMEVLEIELDDVNRKILDCQSACQFLKSGQHKINRPKVIKEQDSEQIKPIRISRKTGMPITQQDDNQEANNETTSKESKEMSLNKGQARPKEETAEEKKARKEAVKAERREKRAMKKAVKAI